MCDCTEEEKKEMRGEAKEKKMPHPTISFTKKRSVIKGKIITSYKPDPAQ